MVQRSAVDIGLAQGERLQNHLVVIAAEGILLEEILRLGRGLVEAEDDLRQTNPPTNQELFDAFAAALDETRARGWGMSYEEGERGIAAIAAPIRPLGPNTPAVATCSVAGPLMRFGADDIVRHASSVMEAANQIAAIWPLRSAQTQADLATAKQLREEISAVS
jgi:hypothetical protein